MIRLSAKTEESDKVSGLTLGADDYIEKPYNPAELIARVKAHYADTCMERRRIGEKERSGPNREWWSGAG